MVNMIDAEPITKKEKFKQFLLLRNPSERFVSRYLQYAKSGVVTSCTRRIAFVDTIYEVNDFCTLYRIYSEVKKNENNIRLHNIYSGIISAYIKFLNGQELRKRVVIKEHQEINQQ